MSGRVNPALIASIPEPSVRQALTAGMDAYQWVTSPWVPQILVDLDEQFLVNLARTSSVEVACSIARGAQSPIFLAKLYQADRRVTVRGEVCQNTKTSVDLVLQHALTLRGRTLIACVRNLIDGATQDRLMELMAHEALRNVIMQHGSVRDIAGTLFEGLRDLPTAQWVEYLGTGAHAATLLYYFSHSGLTPHQAADLLENYPLDPELPARPISDLYSNLAIQAVNGGAEYAVAAYQRMPRLETAVALLREHPQVDFAEVSAHLTEDQRSALALSVCRTPYVLTSDLADSLVKAFEAGHISTSTSYPVRIESGACEVINARDNLRPEAAAVLLRAVLQSGTPEQVACVLNGPHWSDVRPQTLQILQRRSDLELRETVKHLNEGNTATLPVLGEYLRRLNTRGDTSLPPPTRAMVRKYFAALRSALELGTLREAALGGWAPLVQTRGDVVAVLDLANDYPDFQVALSTLAVHAVWWETGGREDTTMRKRVLLMTEAATSDQGSPYWDGCPLERPRALMTAPPALACWMQQHAPRAVDFLLRPLMRRRTQLSPLQEALLPQYPMQWARATDNLFAVAGAYLSGRLTERVEWEAAIVLLQEWDGTLEDVARAATVLSHA